MTRIISHVAVLYSNLFLVYFRNLFMCIREPYIHFSFSGTRFPFKKKERLNTKTLNFQESLSRYFRSNGRHYLSLNFYNKVCFRTFFFMGTHKSLTIRC